ncbi:protein of unknown function [Paenibacillus alvei]|uniref:Uncharacterized protein n=1 Tax=Paenibacillus alvei TaxID=44250 RepID=A0A383RIP2_PAEAL|nr:protein of unknown function [Paenibacillus alvei]
MTYTPQFVRALLLEQIIGIMIIRGLSNISDGEIFSPSTKVFNETICSC